MFDPQSSVRTLIIEYLWLAWYNFPTTNEWRLYHGRAYGIC